MPLWCFGEPWSQEGTGGTDKCVRRGPQSIALPVGTDPRNESDQPSTGVVLAEPSFKELEKEDAEERKQGIMRLIWQGYQKPPK